MRKLLLCAVLPGLLMVAGCKEEDTTGPGSIPASAVAVEAEDMSDFLDRGSAGIVIVDQNGASGGRAVEGLDKTLEWIDIPVHFEGTGRYAVTFRHASVAEGTVTVSVRSPALKGKYVDWAVSLIPGTCGT